jgi:predicted nucleotidyltransferase
MTRMGSIQRGSLEAVCRLGVKPRGDTRDRDRNPRVFGSLLHGDDAEGSDLDLLIDPTADTSLFDIGAIRLELGARGRSDVEYLPDVPC